MDSLLPVPVPTPLTAPYWEACRRGVLALQRCSDCQRFVHFPRAACSLCGGVDLPFVEVSGEGVVHTFSVVHRAFLPGFVPPYVIAWIDLPEGVRVFGNVVDDPEKVRIGMPVRLTFDDRPGFGPIPQWSAL